MKPPKKLHSLVAAFWFMATIYAAGGKRRPISNETTKRSKNAINKTLAISVDVPAIPPNPRNAAIMATIKKVIDQFNI
jgi:hypothetical protein